MEKIEQISSMERLLIEEQAASTDPALNPDAADKAGRPKMINRPKVLMYHRIVDDKVLAQREKTCLHVDELHRQLKLLDHLNFTPITFKDYRLFREDVLQLPRNPVILTFDDGYIDTYRLAFPLLMEFGMKATIFVLGDRSIRTNRWDSDKEGFSRTRLMNDNHILELHENGFEIGSHTLSHPNLKQLDRGDCYNEIYKPKMILESLLGESVHSFSYPYGQVDPVIKTQVYRAGYEFACSVYSGPARFGFDPLEIRRIEVHNSISTAGFVTRLVAPYEFLEWMWWKYSTVGEAIN